MQKVCTVTVTVNKRLHRRGSHHNFNEMNNDSHSCINDRNINQCRLVSEYKKICRIGK